MPRLSAARWRKLSGGGEADLLDDDDEELAGLAEEALERGGKVVVFFRDPSGEILPNDLWYPSATFWSITRQRVGGAIRKRTG